MHRYTLGLTELFFFGLFYSIDTHIVLHPFQQFHDNSCMSFSLDSRTLRRVKTYSQRTHPKMSVNTESVTNTSETRCAEQIEKNIDRIFSVLFEERLSANLDFLNEQILTLINCLINWSKTTWRKLHQRRVLLLIGFRRDLILTGRMKPPELCLTWQSEVLCFCSTNLNPFSWDSPIFSRNRCGSAHSAACLLWTAYTSLP